MRLNFKHTGATLMELMIALAIVGILVTAVGPSVRDILISNRIVAQINELSSVLQFARSQAIDNQIDAVVCPSENFNDCSNDWQLAKMVFLDLDGNGARSDDEEILAGTDNTQASLLLTGPAGVIRFQGNGTTSSPSTLLLCHADGDAHYARALTVSLQGRVRLSVDSDGDGIYEDNSGTELDCGV